MRLRKQKEVQKENEFYMQLLQQALPPEQQMLQRQEREAEEGEPITTGLGVAVMLAERFDISLVKCVLLCCSLSSPGINCD